MAKLIKVDKNGTKYYEETACPKCNGSGYIDYYHWNANGVCFECGGSGYKVQRWKEYTEEYQKVLEDRRIKKLIKKVPEENEKLLKDNNFDENGNTWVVIGNTYDIKDELKEAGAKFRPGLNWHFDHEVEYPTIIVNIDEVTYKSDIGKYNFNEIREIEDVINSKLPKSENEKESEYIGNVGDKIETKVEFIKFASYEISSYSGYGTDVIHVFTFADENGNNLVWKTASFPCVMEKGNNYIIKGTIKDHNEYKGIKQTILNRCKLSSI